MSEGLVLSGRYRLLSRLGSGGMGSVWRARDLTLDADVAIKLMGPELLGSSEAVARFRREARAAAAIRSGHVVQILDHGVDGSTPFIAMELLRGESLAERIQRAGPLSPAATGHLLGHVARALALAHEHGIVHRDLKPENIFIVREGDEDVGKVLDFGVARRREGLGDSSGLETRAGAILGTPYYMSPEQAGGDPVDELSDIWAFGVIACECLTGRRPFGGESLGALFRAVCISEIPPPSTLGPAPEGFDVWFSRAVSRDKSQRYKSVRQAADDLKALCSRFGAVVTPLGVAAATPPVPLTASPSGTQVSAGNAVQPPASFGNTGPASAHSVATSGSSKRGVLVPLLVAGSLLAAAGLYWGSRRGGEQGSPGAAASQSSASLPVATPVAAPAVQQREDAKSEPAPAVASAPERAIAMPSASTAPRVAVPVVREHSAKAVPKRQPTATSSAAPPAAQPKAEMPPTKASRLGTLIDERQ